MSMCHAVPSLSLFPPRNDAQQARKKRPMNLHSEEQLTESVCRQPWMTVPRSRCSERASGDHATRTRRFARRMSPQLADAPVACRRRRRARSLNTADMMPMLQPPPQERLPIRCAAAAASRCWPPTRECRHHAQDLTSNRHRCVDGGSRRRPLHEPPSRACVQRSNSDSLTLCEIKERSPRAD